VVLGFDRLACFTSAKNNDNSFQYLVPVSLEPKIIAISLQYLLLLLFTVTYLLLYNPLIYPHASPPQINDNLGGYPTQEEPKALYPQN